MIYLVDGSSTINSIIETKTMGIAETMSAFIAESASRLLIIILLAGKYANVSAINISEPVNSPSLAIEPPTKINTPIKSTATS